MDGILFAIAYVEKIISRWAIVFLGLLFSWLVSE